MTLVVCDRIRASDFEANVFHLRGVRSHFFVDRFPARRRLRLFVVLSSQRSGRFPSYVKIIDQHTDQAVYYGQVAPAPVFTDDWDLLPVDLPIHARFPNAGRYLVQLWFFQHLTADVLKIEQPFYVLEREK
jgi:hypothetical protein